MGSKARTLGKSLNLSEHLFPNYKEEMDNIIVPAGNSLAVQWLRLRASTSGDTGSIPGKETKIPRGKWCSQKENEQIKNNDSACLSGLW